jgi:hypothetical protein
MPKPCLKDLWVHSTNCGLTMIYDLSGCLKDNWKVQKNNWQGYTKMCKCGGDTWPSATPSHSCSDWDVWSLRERHTHTHVWGQWYTMLESVMHGPFNSCGGM